MAVMLKTNNSESICFCDVIKHWDKIGHWEQEKDNN